MIGREVAQEKNYMMRCLTEARIKFPVTEEPKPLEVEKFACNLQRRMEKRSTAAFNKIILSGQGKETVDFLEFHELRRYVDAIIEYHEGYLTKLKQSNEH